jgi:hypothetical protein
MVKAPVIPDYADTAAGATRGRIDRLNGAQIGDPRKAAEAMITVVKAEDPPLRLPLGIDALTSIRQKLRQQSEDLDRWDALSTRTSFTGT